MSCGNETWFNPTALVERFHSFPHYGRNLKSVSSEFDPLNTEYLEGTAFTGAICLLVGLVLFLATIVYLCCCACRKRGTEYDVYKSQPGCHWAWAILFALVCMGGLGLAYFGNEYVKEGIDSAVTAINDGNQTVKDGQVKIGEIVVDLQNAYVTLGQLTEDWKGKGLPSNVEQELVDQTLEAQREVGSALDESRNIDSTIGNVFDAAKYADDMKKYDDYRWEGTIGALCAIVGLIVIMVIGVCISSSCTLKLAAFLFLFGLIVAWLAAGVFVAVAVLGADFCISPNGFVNRQLSGTSYEETVKYFVYCQGCPNPFQQDYNSTMTNLATLDQKLVDLKAAAESQTGVDLRDAIASISNLQVYLADVQGNLTSLWSKEINCTSLNGAYRSLINAACGKTIDGSVYTFGAGVLVGLSIFFLIIAIQNHWTRILSEDDWFEGEGTRLIEPQRNGKRRPGRRRERLRSQASIQQPRAAAQSTGYGSYRRQTNPEEEGQRMREQTPYQQAEPRQAWTKDTSFA